MSNFDEVFNALRLTAREHGWALFRDSRSSGQEPEAHYLKIIDVRKANFDFDYAEIVREVESPPSLNVHVVDGMGAKSKLGG